MTDPTKRKAPAESDEDWAFLWAAAALVHQAGPSLRAIAAFQNNWKIIAGVVVVAAMAGGIDLLKAMGVPLP